MPRKDTRTIHYPGKTISGQLYTYCGTHAADERTLWLKLDVNWDNVKCMRCQRKRAYLDIRRQNP